MRLEDVPDQPLTPPADTPLPTEDEVRAAVAAVLPSVRADLEHLVRIPSVAQDPLRQGDVRASAVAVAELLTAAGMPEVRVVDVADGRPAVLGRVPAPEGAPTVLLYAHHDVQPEGERAAWTSEPFEPVERDGRLYGRGAADDKAGIAAHLAALRAYGGRPPVGVTVLVEGEEEIGSPTLPAFLAAYRDLLRADVLVLADSMNWRVGQPALTTTLRGLVAVVVEVSTLTHGVHSGMYGGPVPDALMSLTRLLATLHDDRGRCAVEGLSSMPAEPLDLTEAQLRAEAGVLDGVSLVGEGPLTERLWTRPAVTVTGIDAPPVVTASNTLVPSARAKVTLRVPPGQSGERALALLTEHLKRHVPWGARLRVEPEPVGEPFAAETGAGAYAAAVAAFTAAWGVAPVEIGVGGSIPFVASFAEAFPDAAVLVTGVEDPHSRAHGPDESLHLGDFARVCLAEALLLRELAR